VVKLKKYNVAIKQIVLFLTFIIASGCSRSQYHVTKIEGREIGVTEKNPDAVEIEKFIKPYRENIDKDMNIVLAYAPVTLDKFTGEWQTSIGNLMADVVLVKGNAVFNARQKKNIDMSLLNFGGIRSIIPKGNVTTRTAFEIMPFENSLIVAELKGDVVLEMLSYIIGEKKAHPLSGVTFTISKDNQPKNILIQGQPLDNSRTYYVLTSDYLLNGGDNMVFFKKSLANHDLDYKIRNVLIDYFKEVDSIPVINDVRIRKE